MRQIIPFGRDTDGHVGYQVIDHIGGSARGYLGRWRGLSRPGMAYLMIACSVYLYIATLGVNVRICRVGCVLGEPPQAVRAALGQQAVTLFCLAVRLMR
jgi:hypothetical protein